MAYVVTGEFSQPLPDDLQQMGAKLAEITEAWRQFCGVVDADVSELRLIQPRERTSNGAGRRGSVGDQAPAAA
jgi:hypothetical protein